MTISIRYAARNEWPEILTIKWQAIHELAAADYSADVLNAWGPPPTEKGSPQCLSDFDAKLECDQIILVAEIDGRLVGLGELVPDKNEVLAVYVHPDFARRGVGSAILRKLEQLARERAEAFHKAFSPRVKALKL